MGGRVDSTRPHPAFQYRGSREGSSLNFYCKQTQAKLNSIFGPPRRICKTEQQAKHLTLVWPIFRRPLGRPRRPATIGPFCYSLTLPTFDIIDDRTSPHMCRTREEGKGGYSSNAPCAHPETSEPGCRNCQGGCGRFIYRGPPVLRVLGGEWARQLTFAQAGNCD